MLNQPVADVFIKKTPIISPSLADNHVGIADNHSNLWKNSYLRPKSTRLSFVSIGTLNVLATAKDAESRERLLSRSVMVAWCVGALAAKPSLVGALEHFFYFPMYWE